MINSVYDTLLQLSIVTPFAIAAQRNNENSRTGWLIAAALVFIFTSVVEDLLSNITLFAGQQWNWTGKAVALVIVLAFIFTFKSLTLQQFGLTTKVNCTNAKPIFLICATYFLLRVLFYYAATKQVLTFHAETILFQATLPGLEEEVVFRGVLLTLLNHVFTRPKWTFAKVSFGWAVVLTSLLFGLTHGVSFDSSFHLRFNAFAFLRTVFDGFLFALLAEKTKSLVPSILFHNLLNLVGNH